MSSTLHAPHTRADRCPGILRPWIAEDGALVRIRLVGGRLDQPAALLDLAREFGDGGLHLTSRGNVQLRGVAHRDGAPPMALVEALAGLGLLPSHRHDLVRNLMVSPLTGVEGGRADLAPVATALDAAIRADDGLADLPAKFLFVLDDGRGDLHDQHLDLGLVALDDSRAQLRVARQGWGPVIDLADAPAALIGLAHAFQTAAQAAPGIPWHLDELPAEFITDLVPPTLPEPGAEIASPPPAFGVHGTARHVEVPGGVLREADQLTGPIILTPWKSIMVLGAQAQEVGA